jgi:predicted ATP-dependent endonuclease of OLD family
LIDEPQSFLHPGAVRKLLEVLKQYPQHQYIIATHSPTIITAAKPDTIMLVTHDGNESQIQHLNANDADHLRRYLDEIGASLADVFGADDILWVEGITEEKCYPMIVEKILERSLMGTVIKAVIATGDLEGRHAERFFEIYDRLSGAQSLLPPALGFIFDDDGRSETDKNILRNRGRDREKNKDRVYFTKRLMYENYLLHPKAITEVLNATEGHIKTATEVDVQACIDKYLPDPDYYRKLEPNRSGIECIRADLLLKKVFAEVADLDYRKTTHSIELTEWLLAKDPEKLTEVADVIRAALGWA